MLGRDLADREHASEFVAGRVVPVDQFHECRRGGVEVVGVESEWEGLGDGPLKGLNIWMVASGNGWTFCYIGAGKKGRE